MQLITNWFSPFARKVGLALDYKGIAYEAIDGLENANHALLWRLNSRGEVPALIDGKVVVSNSSHILAYLEDAYPERSILPRDAATRAQARALERLFDTRVDPILVNCSLWKWSKRDDNVPEGLREAGQRDLDSALAETETLLASKGAFSFGDTPGLADFALWPHLAAIKPLGFRLDASRFERTAALLACMKATTLFSDDAQRTRSFLKTMTTDTHEMTKIAWRGDRIEWLLARGYHDWLLHEIRSDRVIWPMS
jgi:glutathione S-transferase